MFKCGCPWVICGQVVLGHMVLRYRLRVRWQGGGLSVRGLPSVTLTAAAIEPYHISDQGQYIQVPTLWVHYGLSNMRKT